MPESPAGHEFEKMVTSKAMQKQARGGATPFDPVRCRYCAVQGYAVQRLGLSAPCLFALGAAVRLLEIVLRRVAQWFLTWWVPIRALHHVARLCTTRFARCGVLEHGSLHTVGALHPSQFCANLPRGMIKGAIDAGRASRVQVRCRRCHTQRPGHRPRHHPVLAVQGGGDQTMWLGVGGAAAASTGRARRNLRLPRCARSRRGAGRSHHTTAVQVGRVGGGAVQVRADCVGQCSGHRGPNRRHSHGQGVAVHSHHPLPLAVSQQAAVLGAARCLRQERRWTTQVQGGLCPH